MTTLATMRITMIILALFLHVGLSSYTNHAIYLSVVEITENSISIKVFSDDLRDVIRGYSDEYVGKGLEEFVSANQLIIDSYFSEYFKLAINGQSVKLKLTRAMNENDAYFLYFSFESPTEWKQVKVKGSFFTELFPDQSNVVTIKKNGKKYFARLTKSNPTYEITFD